MIAVPKAFDAKTTVTAPTVSLRDTARRVPLAERRTIVKDFVDRRSVPGYFRKMCIAHRVTPRVLHYILADARVSLRHGRRIHGLA